MQIKEIQVQDFRCHGLVKVSLGKVTLITGPNGSGKSSIVETPATVLTGDNTWARRDGMKLQDQIRRKGKKKAKLTIVGKRAISRLITPKGSSLVIDDKTPLTKPLLMKNLKVSEQQLAATLIPQAFLSLKLRDQKDVLFSLLSTDLTLDDVEKRMPSCGTWKKIRNKWEEDHQEGENVDIDKLYKWVYEQRANYKRKQSAPKKSEEHEKLMERRDELVKQIASAEFDNERENVAAEKIKSLPKWEQELQEQMGNKSKYESLKVDLKEAEERIRELEKDEAVKEAVLEKANEEIEHFSNLKTTGENKKVDCPFKLACPHGEDSIKEKTAKPKGTIVATEGELKGIRTKLKDARAKRRSIQEKLEPLGDPQKRIDELSAEINAATDLTVEEKIDTSKWEKEKGEIDEKLSKVASAPKSSDKTVDELNDIVAALDVGGIKTDIVKENIEKLEKDTDKALAAFGKWKVRFFIDGEFRPTILTPDGDIFLGELSDGERNLISLVLQDVFSVKSGINFVVMDNVDLLDKKVRRQFFEAAKKVKSTVLVAMALTDHIPTDLGIKIHKLGEGEEPEEAPEEDAGEDFL